MKKGINKSIYRLERKEEGNMRVILHCISSVFHSVSYWLYEWK